MKTAGWFVGALVAVSLSSNLTAHAQTESFDPSICPGETNGKVTVRLISGLAFQFPPEGFLLGGLGPPAEGDDLPPEGCPGNPVVVRSMSFPLSYVALLKDRYPQEPYAERPELIQIFGHDGPVSIQTSEIRFFEEYRSKHGNCQVYEGDLVACRSGKGRDDRHGHHYPASLVAKPGAYEEFDGRPFAGSCDWADRRGHRTCRFAYQMDVGLSVSWRMRTLRVKEDRIIAMDREIRRQIRAARAPEYDKFPEEN